MVQLHLNTNTLLVSILNHLKLKSNVSKHFLVTYQNVRKISKILEGHQNIRKSKKKYQNVRKFGIFLAFFWHFGTVFFIQTRPKKIYGFACIADKYELSLLSRIKRRVDHLVHAILLKWCLSWVQKDVTVIYQRL